MKLLYLPINQVIDVGQEDHIKEKNYLETLAESLEKLVKGN